VVETRIEITIFKVFSSVDENYQYKKARDI
jgi:hypothetical protein